MRNNQSKILIGAMLLVFGVATATSFGQSVPSARTASEWSGSVVDQFSDEIPASSLTSGNYFQLSKAEHSGSTPPILRQSDWRTAGDSGNEFFRATAEDQNPNPNIPEPMVFDLVRALGARKGELEINTLAFFPWRSINRDPSRDPFGSGQTTPDLGLIEWAPEIEYAFADNWAIEFEFPFEGSELESYKVGLQGTFGTAFDGQYIHGFQCLVEPNTDWQNWNSTMLYLAGLRFDENWSVLMMLGGRMDLSGRNNASTFERLFNATLFNEINETITLATEINHAAGNRGRNQTLIVPQLHYNFSQQIQLQSGIGVGLFDEGSEQSVIVRAVWSRE